MQVVETEAANLKQVLHSLAATSSTGVLAPAASAVLTTALQSTVSMKKNVSKAREFFALNFDDLGSSEEAWTCLRKMEDLKECVVDRDMPLLLHQAIAAVIKITNVAGKKILEFPFGDAEWRECIRFRYAYVADLFEVLYFSVLFIRAPVLPIGAGHLIQRFFVENFADIPFVAVLTIAILSTMRTIIFSCHIPIQIRAHQYFFESSCSRQRQSGCQPPEHRHPAPAGCRN